MKKEGIESQKRFGEKTSERIHEKCQTKRVESKRTRTSVQKDKLRRKGPVRDGKAKRLRKHLQ
jgi:hypothetical protein